MWKQINKFCLLLINVQVLGNLALEHAHIIHEICISYGSELLNENAE